MKISEMNLRGKLLAWISKDLGEEDRGEGCEVEGFFEILLKYFNRANSRNAFEIIFDRCVGIMLVVGYWNLLLFHDIPCCT